MVPEERRSKVVLEHFETLPYPGGVAGTSRRSMFRALPVSSSTSMTAPARRTSRSRLLKSARGLSRILLAKLAPGKAYGIYPIPLLQTVLSTCRPLVRRAALSITVGEPTRGRGGDRQ